MAGALRKEAELLRGRQVDSGAAHGRTLFLTVCAVASDFNTFCGPLFVSFERAYREEASRHRLVAFVSPGLDQSMLRLAEARFAPWLRFEYIDGTAGHVQATAGFQPGSWSGAQVVCTPAEAGQPRKCRPAAADADSADKQATTSRNSILQLQRAQAYLREHDEAFQYAVMLDSDVLFAQPLGQFLTAVADWDVAVSAYDEELSTPWAASAEEVGMTRRGYRRLSAGVMLFSLRDGSLVRRYLHRLAHAAEMLLTAGQDRPADEVPLWRQWQQDLLGEFGNAVAAAIVLLMSSYNPTSLTSLLGWRHCLACSEAVEAQLAMFSGESPMPLRFRALPARLLAHAESMHGGIFPSGLSLVHLKGMWWRVLLSSNIIGFDATRQLDWNRDALTLHRICFNEWQLVLPPERREVPPVASYDVECSNLS